MSETAPSTYAEQLLASARGRFTWPSDAVLYRLPKERELLTDKARRLVFECYLQLAKLPYLTTTVHNADYMSPTGTAPFLSLKLGTHPLILADFDRLVTFLEAQNLGLTAELEGGEKANKHAFISLVKTKIVPAEEYETWVNRKNVSEHTCAAYGHGLPWPLKLIVPRIEQCKFCWNHWEVYQRPENEVLLDFEQACAALSERLGRNETFFPAGLTTLDAVVYGHVWALMSTALPSSDLAAILARFKNLEDFCRVSMAAQGLRLDS